MYVFVRYHRKEMAQLIMQTVLAPPLGLEILPKGDSPKEIVPIGIAMLYPTVYARYTNQLGDKPSWWFHLYIRDDK